MKETTTQRPLTNEEACEVSGAGLIKTTPVTEAKAILIPPRYFTLALGENGGDYPEESVY